MCFMHRRFRLFGPLAALAGSMLLGGCATHTHLPSFTMGFAVQDDRDSEQRVVNSKSAEIRLGFSLTPERFVQALADVGTSTPEANQPTWTTHSMSLSEAAQEQRSEPGWSLLDKKDLGRAH